MSESRLSSAWYGLVTLALAPGILAHEYAHVLACRLWSVDVHSLPVLNPFGEDAYVDHEPIDSFGPDLTVAVAPLAANTLLGVAAFSLGARVDIAALALLCYWLGVSFAVTAFPSASDTDGLLDTARSLPRWLRPLGFLAAYPVRAFTRLPGAVGFAGGLWIFVLYALAAGASG